MKSFAGLETLKIVQVAHAFPPYIGGLSHVVKMLSKSLADQGHDVEIVTLDPSGKLKREERRYGVQIRRFKCFAPSNCYFMPSPKVFSYIRSINADVVHAHNIAALLAPISWLAFRTKPRKAIFILSPHHHKAGSRWHTKMLWIPYKPIAKYVVRSAHAVHCVSEYEAELVKEVFNVNPIVVPNGVSDDVFRYCHKPPSDNLTLTYAGRLEKYKKVHVMIRAAEILTRKGFNVNVRIIGEGLELQELQNLSAKLGVTMEHYPFLERSRYLELLSTSSCFVNLSEYEAFSIVTAEAIAIGLPVVVSRTWGKTFGHLSTVLLVEEDSPEIVVEAILKARTINTHVKHSILPWRETAKKLVKEVYMACLQRSNDSEEFRNN